jgi:hypothetical protein
LFTVEFTERKKGETVRAGRKGGSQPAHELFSRLSQRYAYGGSREQTYSYLFFECEHRVSAADPIDKGSWLIVSNKVEVSDYSSLEYSILALR